MKRIILFCLLMVITLPDWAPAAAIGPARIRSVYGDTLFQTPDSEEWLPATVNTPLEEGDAVWCPDGSRVEIQLPDGSVVRLDGGSQLHLLANEEGFAHLHLARGRLYLRTAQAIKDNSLQIDADDTTVLPSARTRLRIDMLPDNMEDVAITRGAAYVEGNGSRTRVRAGEHILLDEGHNEILPLNPPDSWEAWNVDRDREQSRSARADSYLPEELRGYTSELDASGTWVRVPEYGMVWRPTVIVTSDWAPYRSGRWVWKGDDYVWLSYEGWGWAPYHYGRWAVVSGVGWCWVPPARGDVYWAPGYVGWYRTGSHVGWTPLAPGETFYGRRYYGRNSVNITTVNVNTSTVVYRNRTYPGGLTVMPHNDFQKGRTPAQQPARNSAVAVSVSVGGPRIQPIRETRMPIVKQTPPRVAPPQTEHRDARELRNRYPRVIPGQTVAVPPAVPAGRTPQTRETRPANPAVVTGDRPVTPVRQPQQQDRQRDERRQGSTTPATTQTVPPVSQGQPPVSGSVPQRAEQPRRASPSPAADRARPATVPPQAGTVPPHKETVPREAQQKKVWKVTTPEHAVEKEQKGGDNKTRERRDK
jgi:hypothetical protein